MPPQSEQSSIAWITYALMTVAAWGVYGIFLQIGGDGMAGEGSMRDPAIATIARLKAFLFVGIAYFLTAVVLPFAMLWVNKSTQWNFHGQWLVVVADCRRRGLDRGVLPCCWPSAMAARHRW